MTGDNLNHPSFDEEFPGGLEAAGLALVRQAVAHGVRGGVLRQAFG